MAATIADRNTTVEPFACTGAGAGTAEGAPHRAASGNTAYIHTEPSDWSSNGFADHLRGTFERRRRDGAGTAETARVGEGASRGLLGRIALVAAGGVLVLVGIPLLILPGPGIALIVAGGALLATGLGLRRTDRSTSAGRS